MADDFVEYGRGIVNYNGHELVEVTTFNLRVDNGSGLVATKTLGIAGFHKGTKRGSISFTNVVPRAGASDDFKKVVDKGLVVSIDVLPSDDTTITITGIIRALDYTGGEANNVTAQYTLEGRPTFS